MYELETHMEVFIIIFFVKSLQTIITLCLESHLKYLFCLNWGSTQSKAEKITQLLEFPGRDRGPSEPLLGKRVTKLTGSSIGQKHSM